MTDQTQQAERTHSRVIDERKRLAHICDDIKGDISTQVEKNKKGTRTFVNSLAVALFAAVVAVGTTKGAHESFTSPPTDDEAKAIQLEAKKKCIETAALSNIAATGENLSVCSKSEEGHLTAEWKHKQLVNGALFSLAALFSVIGSVGMGNRVYKSARDMNGSKWAVNGLQRDLQARQQQIALLSKILE